MNDEVEVLYKYRAIDENNLHYTERIFTHNELYFPSKNAFNDPFDCKFDYSFAASDEEIRKYFIENLKRSEPQMNRGGRRKWLSARKKEIGGNKFQEGARQGTENIISSVGIFSLSEVPNNILMWSHYAMSHTGFCLAFKCDESDPFFSVAHPVKYSERYPIVNPITDNDIVRMEKSLLTKSLEWKYERERRIIEYHAGPGVKRFPAHLLSAVIFGCRMSDEYKSKIRSWCESGKTTPIFSQAVLVEKTYGIEIIGV